MSLAKLVKKRATIKAKITRFNDHLSSLDPDTLDTENLEIRLATITLCFNDYEQIQSDIEELDDSENNSKKSDDERSKFENDYFAVISRTKKLLNRPPASESGAPPSFDGKYESWIAFRDNFKSLIDSNHSLDNVQKLTYLKLALKPECGHTIQLLDITDDNYDIAWTMLRERYERNKLLINAHIQKIVTLPNQAKPQHIQQILDGLTRNLETLKKLQQPVNEWSAIIIYIITEKLDSKTLHEWEKYSLEIESPKILDLTKFMKQRCTLDEAVKRNNKPTQPARRVTSTAVNAAYASTPTFACYLCKQHHALYRCQKFNSLEPSERLVKVRELNLCPNCLRAGHASTHCKGGTCRLCSGKHHTLLHLGATAMPTTSGIVSAHSQNVVASHSLLPTAVIYIANRQGDLIRVRALLDSGSTCSFITRNLAEKLRLNRVNVRETIYGITPGTAIANEQVRTTLQSLHGNYNVEAVLIIKQPITVHIPVTTINVDDFQLSAVARLADPRFNIPAEIDLLLGVDLFWEVINGPCTPLGTGQPYIVDTKWGKVITGKRIESSLQSKQVCHVSISDPVDQIDFERFWDITDQVGNTTQGTHFCEQHFAENTQRLKDGRFCVKLPTNDNIDALPSNEHESIRRFLALGRRLSKNSELKENYVAFLQEYEQLGHMNEVHVEELSGRRLHFLPHHPVLKESSSTTKCRVVFDASCRGVNGTSLNECLHTGPKIQPELFAILIKSRSYRFCFSADIIKMYRQVLVSSDDTYMQMIHWRKTPLEDIKTYRLKTVTYGTAPASFLATRCLVQLAKENPSRTEAAEAIATGFYMDDLIRVFAPVGHYRASSFEDSHYQNGFPTSHPYLLTWCHTKRRYNLSNPRC